MKLHHYIGIIGLLPLVAAARSPFEVRVNNNGSYALAVKGVTWLPSGPTWFNNDGKRYCSKEGTLKLIGHNESHGEDHIGEWNTTTFIYQAGSLNIQTSIKTYVKPALPLAIFSQKYVNAARKTRGKHADDIISNFPSFKVQKNETVDLGYLAYGNDMAGWVSLSLGKWTADMANFTTGIQGGPLVVFDNRSNAIVISPYSKFMAASNDKFCDGHYGWGILGLVDNVYPGYSIDFIAYFSDKGVNEAIRGWGKHLTNAYAKSKNPRDTDLTLTHLGYWTDNGAYYYYNPEKGKNYEETLLDTVDYFNKIGLPVKYVQIDSYFYPKGHVKGTKTWVPEQSLFPHGFDGLYKKTGLPIGLHNRYWDNDTTYATYNGGKYKFISDKTSGYAVPDDQKFWNDLLNTTKEWGKVILYEQDWLNKETLHNEALLNDLDLGRRWLLQMGEGASKAGLTIQYCMAFSRHLLQSLEIPQVTQVRVSDDYQPGNVQYKIGFTAMFADAIGLAPSKDTFWTTEEEPGNPYHLQERVPQMQTLMATLSSGPVGPGDSIEYLNASLLMRCCDWSGKVLRASRPLTVMDKAIKEAAFGNTNPTGRGEFLYSTISEVSGTVFGIIVGGDIVGSYSLEPSDLSPHQLRDSEKRLTYVYNAMPDAAGKYQFKEWSSQSKVTVDSETCGTNESCIFYSTTAFGEKHGSHIALVGELESKFTHVSPQRFSDLKFDGKGRLEVKALISAAEVIDVWFLIKTESSELVPLRVRCDSSVGQGYVKATVWADVHGYYQCNV